MGDSGNAPAPSMVLLGNAGSMAGVPLDLRWELEYDAAVSGLSLTIGVPTTPPTPIKVWDGGEVECRRVMGALLDDLGELNVGATWQVISMQLRDPLPSP